MSYHSPYPDVHIPDASLFDFLFNGLQAAELDRDAIVDSRTGETLTYRKLVLQAEHLAGALSDRGLQPADVVAVFAANNVMFPVVLHGAMRAGLTVTPLNALGNADDVAKQLLDSGARMIFTTPELLAVAQDAANLVGIAPAEVVCTELMAGIPFLGELIGQELSPPALVLEPRTHPAVLPYSSGTTGRPKGVVLTHQNLVANLCQIREHIGIDVDDRVLTVLPMFHIYGLNVLLNASLQARATIVLGKFDTATFASLVHAHRCTYLFIAPPIAVALVNQAHIDAEMFSSVHTVFSGAASLDRHIASRLSTMLGCNVRQGYGMSELSPVSHLVPQASTAIPLDSIGVLMPNIEAKVIDVSSHIEIPSTSTNYSQPGELWVKGPNVMLGYLNNESATADTLDADGFLHTGDIVRTDPAGNFYVVDRLKELIKYKGYQVPPAELEAVLLTHPDVIDCAVVGAIDDSGEEVPKAFVVSNTASLAAQDVMDFVRERVAPHKRVRIVEFIDAIPKSATGKILRRELRQPVR